MTDNPDTAARPCQHPLASGTELRLRSSLDLGEIARLVVSAVVPDFADAATAFAVEHPPSIAELTRPGDDAEVTVRRLGTRLADTGQQVTQQAFPTGEVIALAADSPCTRCMRSAAPVIFTRPDSQTLVRIRRQGRNMLSRWDGYLAVPTSAGGQVTGFLAFARANGSPAFSDADVATAARLAAWAGTGMANALTLSRQQCIADTLQRSLLAAEPVVPAGLEVAARCLPAAGQIVGGDWHDIIALPGDRSGIIVGDVMGHGPEAAAVMAQMRAAAHALAQLDLKPAELLGHLDRTTATLRRPMLATCVYAIIDPGSQSCVVSTAGHLPPVLAMPDGTTLVPDLPGGQSLGLGSGSYEQARVELPPGAVIALYTDGLVETRTRSFDQGILALRSALAEGCCQLEATCDALIASLAERYEDDVTLILARDSRCGCDSQAI